MAVLESAPRMASVTATEPTRLLRLEQDALYELMADRIEVARGIIRVLSGRLRERVQDVAELRERLSAVAGRFPGAPASTDRRRAGESDAAELPAG
jgi:CRP-like cAMP-binding protein